MSDKQEQKSVYIGGICGGIGSAVANFLSSQNWTVGGYARDAAKVEKLAEAHPDWIIDTIDAGDQPALQDAMKSFAERAGGLHAYVHAVGSVFLKPLHMTKPEEWGQVIFTNLTTAFHACGAALGPMRKQRGGSLVLFSSVAARSGLSNHEAIAAAKGGIEGLVKSLAATYASSGIRANAIAPGLVETPATAALTSSEQARSISEKLHPLGRLGTADEVASLVGWLVSDNGSWMSGQVLSLDGGISSIVPKPRV